MYGKSPITGQNRANPIGFERRQDTGALRRHFAKAAFLPHSNSSANRSLARYLPGFVVIYREISKGFLEMGISKFESYVVSQQVQSLQRLRLLRRRSPPTRRFLSSTIVSELQIRVFNAAAG
jgi:hypothetical protein